MSTLDTNLDVRHFVRQDLATPIIGRTPLALLIASVEGATVLAMRIADAIAAIRSPEVVTARALAPLPDLLGLAEPWLSTGARGLFHKGRDYQAEVDNAVGRWRFDLVKHQSVVERDSVVLEVTNLSRIIE